MIRKISVMMLLLASPVAADEVKTSVEANVVGYEEVEYTLKMGPHYDRGEATGPSPVVPLRRPREVPPHIQPVPAATAADIPLDMIDATWDVTSSSSIIPADTDLAVGPSHVVAVASTGVFVYN
ncbi:MAG: hypothetical protein AAFX50_12675, partial [Acidobacteriota bacterium]